MVVISGDASDRSLAGQPRKNPDHSVSFPPHLRTIVEQKSLEEREAEELRHLPPSPIRNYIDSFHRGQAGPLFPGCTEPSFEDDEGKSRAAPCLTDCSIVLFSTLLDCLFAQFFAFLSGCR